MNERLVIEVAEVEYLLTMLCERLEAEIREGWARHVPVRYRSFDIETEAPGRREIMLEVVVSEVVIVRNRHLYDDKKEDPLIAKLLALRNLFWAFFSSGMMAIIRRHNQIQGNNIVDTLSFLNADADFSRFKKTENG